MATSLSVLPDKFDHGDFNSWLRNFDVCATANGWSDADKLRKLPAFLRGQASSFYHTLAAADTDTYAHLTSSLRRLLCPKVARERYFSEFDRCSLRPGEDPSLCLYELTEFLFKADPDLSDDAKNALLARQLMKGLPADTRLKLLESKPTPTLAQMCDFIHSFYATRPSSTSSPSAAFATGTADRPSDAFHLNMSAQVQKDGKRLTLDAVVSNDVSSVVNLDISTHLVRGHCHPVPSAATTLSMVGFTATIKRT